MRQALVVGLVGVVAMGCAVESAPSPDNGPLDPAASSGDTVPAPDRIVYPGTNCAITAMTPVKVGSTAAAKFRIENPGGACLGVPMGVKLYRSPGSNRNLAYEVGSMYNFTGYFSSSWCPVGSSCDDFTITAPNAYTYVSGDPVFWSRSCFGASCPTGPDWSSCPLRFGGLQYACKSAVAY